MASDSTSHVPTIILIGLRGSGKSTVARLLGARLKRDVVDLDELSPGFLGEKTPADAIRKHGEPAFRRAELSALLEALKTPARILALGGGTPTAPGVAEMLEGAKKTGSARIIYLRACEATLRKRLEAEDQSHRPTLTGKGTVEEIGVLLNLRDTLYKTLASIVTEVDMLDAQQTLHEIETRIAG